jgi:alanine racemase
VNTITKRYIVEKEKISHNIAVIQKQSGDAMVYAVVKCDGYGTGCRNLVRVCAEAGLRRYAVTEVREAKIVAEETIAEELLMLNSICQPEDIVTLAEIGTTFTVASLADAQLLSQYCQDAQHSVCAHVKIDTGMGRRGFRPEDIQQVLELYFRFPEIKFTGIYTHFGHALDPKATKQQYEKFRTVLAALEKAGIDPGVRHCCNSVSIFHHGEMALDAVRAGSCLLGRILGGSKFGLQRTGMCQAPIECVRTLPKGSTIGYGGIYRTTKETKVALCSVGGHNGFGLSLKPGLQSTGTGLLDLLAIIRNRLTGRDVPTVKISGKSCRVLGCICSEAVMIDVTGVDCRAGDVAEFDINPLMLNDMEVEYI